MEMQLEPREIKFRGRVMRVSELKFNDRLCDIELVRRPRCKDMT